MSTDMSIGRSVSAFRGDMSQQALADKMRERGWKWSQATVWSVEKGERPLRLAEAMDLAQILGIRDLLQFGSTPKAHELLAAWRKLDTAKEALKAAGNDYEAARAEFVRTALAGVHAENTYVGNGIEIVSRTAADVIVAAYEHGEISPGESVEGQVAALRAAYGDSEMSRDGEHQATS